MKNVKIAVDRSKVYKPGPIKTTGDADRALAQVPENSRYYHQFKRWVEDRGL